MHTLILKDVAVSVSLVQGVGTSPGSDCVGQRASEPWGCGWRRASGAAAPVTLTRRHARQALTGLAQCKRTGGTRTSVASRTPRATPRPSRILSAAQVSLPLYVAPVLKSEQLEKASTSMGRPLRLLCRS